MSNQEVTIKCGACKVPVEGPADPQNHDVLSCPSCGNADTLKNILAEVEESAADQLAEKFDGIMSDMARRWRLMTHKPSARVEKPRRFIVELTL